MLQNFLLRIASHSILSRDSLFQGFLKDVSATGLLYYSTVFKFIVFSVDV